MPYHYGRWAYDPLYGWFWLPGAAYSPAWVYWMYSPGYIGWAPAGWYDCYRPYYDWAYRPYARAGFDFGFGFSGRVRVNEVDLRPWTFVDANTIISGRVDRAAIGADIVRARLTRAPADLAWVSGSPARFGRNDLRDPAGAVNEIYRRGLTGATGQVLPSTDMTSFFRREATLPAQVRDRIVRGRPVDGVVVGTAGSVAPIGSGSVAPIGRGSVAPIGGGSVAPTTGGNVHRGDGGTWRNSGSGSTGGSKSGGSNTGGSNTGSRDSGSGRINRGSEPKHEEVTPAPSTAPAPTWRNRIIRGNPGPTEPVDRPATPPPSSSTTPRGDSWRGRTTTDPAPADATPPPPAPSGRSRSVDRGTSDVPRRIIDGIGGTRIYRGEGSSTPPPRTPESRPSPPPQHQSPPPPPPEHRDSGSHSDGGKVHRDKQ